MKAIDKTKEQLIQELVALRERNAVLDVAMPRQTSPARLGNSSWLAATNASSDHPEAQLAFCTKLLETVQEAVIATDLGGHVIYWNSFAEHLYGYPAAEALGKTTLDLIATEDSMAHGQEIMAQLQDGNSWAGEYLARHRDGTQIPIYTTIAPMHDDDGNLTALVAVSGHAITDRQRAEQALRKSEERFRQTLANSNITVWHQDKDLRYTWLYNPHPAFVPEAVIGKTDQDLLPPDFADRMTRLKQTVLDSGRAASREVATPFGETLVFYDLSVEPLRDSTGAIAGITCIAVDITDRKQAEQALAESEERFRTSVENMLDAFGIYSAIRNDDGCIVDFRIEYVNQAACKLNQMTKEAQLGKRLCELLPAHRETGLFDEYCQVVETGQPLIKESLFYEDVYNEKRLSRAFDIRAAKLADGFVASWRDITGRKQAEETLRDSEANLREANTTKDKFFSIIAHDLRNPIIALDAGTEMLAKRLQNSEDPFVRKVSHELDKTSRRVLRLLEDLLSWSQIQRGKISYEPIDVDLHTPAGYCFSLLQDSANQKQIGLTSLIAEGTIVYADYDMLSTILRNLISNAIKFTPNGGEVTIQAEERGDFFEIVVTDNGTGIDAAKVQRLFKTGEKRISTTGTAGEKGTALGLILCKEFVEKQGGSIWIESRQGTGTTVRFTLPKGKG